MTGKHILDPVGRDYGAIVADPAWSYLTWSKRGQHKSASRHYQTMTLDEIKELPVQSWGADDCVLFLWCINPMLPQALDVIEAWEFEFKTVAFVWVKTTAKGKYPIGLGHWTRANPELCLLATRGKPKRLSKAVKMLVFEERRDHSEKPDVVYDRIRQLVAGPYLDAFARGPREGWDVWGRQAVGRSKRRRSILNTE